jgi:hypothetical protein
MAAGAPKRKHFGSRDYFPFPTVIVTPAPLSRHPAAASAKVLAQ